MSNAEWRMAKVCGLWPFKRGRLMRGVGEKVGSRKTEVGKRKMWYSAVGTSDLVALEFIPGVG